MENSKKTQNNKSVAIIISVVAFILVIVIGVVMGTRYNEPPVDTGITESQYDGETDEDKVMEYKTSNKLDEVISDLTGQSDKTEQTENVEVIEGTTLKDIVGTTNPLITTTRPNKVTTTKPYVTTTKPFVTTTQAGCKHQYTNSVVGGNCWYNKGNGTKVQICLKCEEWTSTACNFIPSEYMGTKSEYLKMLELVNKARRENGLKELVYLSEYQSGANTRAVECNTSYSHTRPNGTTYSTVYGNYSEMTGAYKYYLSIGENIHRGNAGYMTPANAVNGWLNSSGHRAEILRQGATGFVCSYCNGCWVMSTFTPYDKEYFDMNGVDYPPNTYQ